MSEHPDERESVTMPNHHRAMIRREEHFYARFRRKPVKVEPPGPQFGSGWFDPTERVDIRLAVLRVNIGDGLHVRPDSLPTARAAGIGEDGECRVPGVVAHFHTALMITTPSAMASTGFPTRRRSRYATLGWPGPVH